MNASLFSKNSFSAMLAFIPVAVTFHDFFYSIHRVHGRSMEPTLQDGDLILVRRFDWPASSNEYVYDKKKKVDGSTLNACMDTSQSHFLFFSFPPRFCKDDLILFKSPTEFPAKMCIKRLSDFACEKGQGSSISKMLPPNSMWVEGDNREYSEDSNYFGPISSKLTVGKVEKVMWPPRRWKSLT